MRSVKQEINDNVGFSNYEKFRKIDSSVNKISKKSQNALLSSEVDFSTYPSTSDLRHSDIIGVSHDSFPFGHRFLHIIVTNLVTYLHTLL